VSINSRETKIRPVRPACTFDSLEVRSLLLEVRKGKTELFAQMRHVVEATGEEGDATNLNVDEVTDTPEGITFLAALDTYLDTLYAANVAKR